MTIKFINNGMPPRLRILKLTVLAVSLAVAVPVKADKDSRAGHYRQLNLVSDLPGVALLQDTNLVNAWGVSFSANSPFWISDNGSGLTTLYTVTNDSSGMVRVTKVGLEVSIPGEGTPTGQLFDGTGSFRSNIFIFASEDGTVSGWHGALGASAEVLVTRSNAVYKGITLLMTSAGPMLLAANFREATLDAYDTNLTLVAQFSDAHAPAGYAPFNVHNFSGTVLVTFAKQDGARHDDVPGRGHGLIDIFDASTGVFHRVVSGSDAGGKLHEIDSPWGMAMAPSTFGKHAGQLLVGNFGSGTIMTFDTHGTFRGLLKAVHHGPVVIDGLWALTFGNGGRGGNPDTLYFTAGPDSEMHGLFGSLDPVKGEGDGDDD